MDWTVIWSAAGVIVALTALIVGCFRSLSNKMGQTEIRLFDKLSKIDERLSRLEGAFEKRGKWESRRKINE